MVCFPCLYNDSLHAVRLPDEGEGIRPQLQYRTLRVDSPQSIVFLDRAGTTSPSEILKEPSQTKTGSSHAPQLQEVAGSHTGYVVAKFQKQVAPLVILELELVSTGAIFSCKHIITARHRVILQDPSLRDFKLISLQFSFANDMNRIHHFTCEKRSKHSDSMIASQPNAMRTCELLPDFPNILHQYHAEPQSPLYSKSWRFANDVAVLEMNPPLPPSSTHFVPRVDPLQPGDNVAFIGYPTEPNIDDLFGKQHPLITRFYRRWDCFRGHHPDIRRPSFEFLQDKFFGFDKKVWTY